MSYNHNQLLDGNKLVKRGLAGKLRKSMTKAECVLWNGLRANSLHGSHFRRQVVVCGFVADFYCHKARLIVEVDGEIHDEQQEYDQERDGILTSQGYRILRFKNKEVYANVYSVMQTIAIALKSL